MSRERREGRSFYWLEPIFWSLHSLTWDEPLSEPGRLAQIEEVAAWLAGHLQPGQRTLDLGCGTGNYTLALAAGGIRATGVDFSPGMLAKARKKALDRRLQGASFRRADLNRPLPFPAASFEAALCVFALQCVSDPVAFLAETRRLLVPGGLFLLRSKDPAQRGRVHRHSGISLLSRVFWGFKGLAGRGVRPRAYRRDELLSLLRDNGFDLVGELARPRDDVRQWAFALLAKVRDSG